MLGSGELIRVQPSPVAQALALQHANRALEIDPAHPMAHAFAGYLLSSRALAGASRNPMRDRFQARRHMARALAGDDENPVVLAMSSEIAMYSAGDIDRSLALAEAAVQHGPNDAQAIAQLAHVRRTAGEDPLIALALIAQAQRLSPRDPRNVIWLCHAGWCHWKLHDFNEMAALARQSTEINALSGWNWLQLAGALALQGRMAEGRAAYGVMRELMPAMTPRRFHWTARLFYRRRFTGHVKQDYTDFCEALQKVASPND
jgi:tetratricopeptide (TPR) repeat protein